MTEHDAFILGVTSFCKKAGLDAEDAAQMTRLLLMPPFRAKPILEKVALTSNPYMHPSTSQPLQARQQPTQPAPGMQPAADTGGGGGALNTAANLAYLAPAAKGALGTAGSTIGSLGSGVAGLGGGGLAGAGLATGGVLAAGAAGAALGTGINEGLAALGVTRSLSDANWSDWRGKRTANTQAATDAARRVMMKDWSTSPEAASMRKQLGAIKDRNSPQYQNLKSQYLEKLKGGAVSDDELASARQGIVDAQAEQAATQSQVDKGLVRKPDVGGAPLTPAQRFSRMTANMKGMEGMGDIVQQFSQGAANDPKFRQLARTLQSTYNVSDPRFVPGNVNWDTPAMKEFRGWLEAKRGPVPGQRANTVSSGRGNRTTSAGAGEQTPADAPQQTAAAQISSSTPVDGDQGATGESPASAAPVQTTEQAQTSSSPTPDVADPARNAALEANEKKYDEEWAASQKRMTQPKNPAQAAAAETAGQPTGETEPAAKTPQTMGEFNKSRIADLEKQKKMWSIKQDGQEVAMGQWGGHSGYRDY